MESCSHIWIYDHTDHDTVYMRCPYCNMVRLAMPGEPCHVVSRELNIRHDGEEGDA
jgi:DNA-directed RNA polymerase subunit RPC12/RpoP